MCVFFSHKKDNMTALTEVCAELLQHRDQFWLYIGELKTSQGKWYWIWVALTGLTSTGMGFPVGSDCKESACSAGDLGLGRSPGEENGNPLQYSCLENLRDSRAWQATVHGVAKSQTQLSNFTDKKALGIGNSINKSRETCRHLTHSGSVDCVGVADAWQGRMMSRDKAGELSWK